MPGPHHGQLSWEMAVSLAEETWQTQVCCDNGDLLSTCHHCARTFCRISRTGVNSQPGTCFLQVTWKALRNADTPKCVIPLAGTQL